MELVSLAVAQTSTQIPGMRTQSTGIDVEIAQQLVRHATVEQQPRALLASKPTLALSYYSMPLQETLLVLARRVATTVGTMVAVTFVLRA